MIKYQINLESKIRMITMTWSASASLAWSAWFVWHTWFESWHDKRLSDDSWLYCWLYWKSTLRKVDMMKGYHMTVGFIWRAALLCWSPTPSLVFIAATFNDEDDQNDEDDCDWWCLVPVMIIINTERCSSPPHPSPNTPPHPKYPTSPQIPHLTPNIPPHPKYPSTPLIPSTYLYLPPLGGTG